MSDERWIKVNGKDAAESAGRPSFVVSRYDAAEGQRVESIRWCETHDQHARRAPGDCFPGEGTCRIVAATLILPPKDAT